MTDPGQLSRVYCSNSRKACRQRSLVLQAAGIDHRVADCPGDFALLVLPADAARARRQLEAYERENPPTSALSKTPTGTSGGWIGVAGYAAILIAVEILRQSRQFNLDWLEHGQSNAAMIRNGQWWRSVTALTLHGDLPHLVGNLVIGGLFGLFVGKLLGSGVAWLSILITGAAGNLLNALVRHPGHSSIGASTAVFAALGILAGSTLFCRRHAPSRWLARWSPVIGGAILLGYLGTGGERTDVGAHVGGFLSGLVLGGVYGNAGARPAGGAVSQVLYAAATIVIVATAWMIALRTT